MKYKIILYIIIMSLFNACGHTQLSKKKKFIKYHNIELLGSWFREGVEIVADGPRREYYHELDFYSDGSFKYKRAWNEYSEHPFELQNDTLIVYSQERYSYKISDNKLVLKYIPPELPELVAIRPVGIGGTWNRNN